MVGSLPDQKPIGRRLTMQFRLRTLLIVLAVGPVVLAVAWWYWKAAIGLALLTLLFFPDAYILAGAVIWELVAWLRSSAESAKTQK